MLFQRHAVPVIVHPNAIPVAFTVPYQHPQQHPQQQQQIAYYMSSPSSSSHPVANVSAAVMSGDQMQQNRHLFAGRIDDQYIQDVCTKLFMTAVEEEQKFKAQESRNASDNSNTSQSDSKDESLKSSSSLSSLDVDSNSDPAPMDIGDNAPSRITACPSSIAEHSHSGEKPKEITAVGEQQIQEHSVSPPLAADTLATESDHVGAERLEIAVQEAVLTQFRGNTWPLLFLSFFPIHSLAQSLTMRCTLINTDILQTLVTQASKGKGAASEGTTTPHTSFFHPGTK